MRARLALASLASAFVVGAACGRSDLDLSTDTQGAGGAGAHSGSSVSSTSESSGPSSSSGSSSSSGPTSSSSVGPTSTSSVGMGGAISFCGDGVLDPGEQCDDGNFQDNDACTSQCVAATCGDNIVWKGVEQCDDGNLSNADSCVAGCVSAKCGDKFVWAGVEQCDDGNQNQGDGCHNNCTTSACGDGIVDPGEQCDDGNASSLDGCVAGCVSAKCGDGFVWAGVEECDDGNLANGDGCSGACKLPGCGDGFVDPNEACDLGAANADRPAFLLLQGALSQPVAPIDRVVSAPVFYAYSSASGHTGYEALKGSRAFLYRDVTTGILSLFFVHGIDFNSSGLSQPQGTANFSITNLPAAVAVALADDTPSEFFKSSPTSAQGAWKFQNNADGGVLSGLPIPGNWSIDVAPGFSAAITDWSFVNGDDSLQALALAQTATLKAFDTPSACRLDCTVPVCGDGILDGGEVCDDGNTQGGDGCSANCKALQ